jgi:hypothetical protein
VDKGRPKHCGADIVKSRGECGTDTDEPPHPQLRSCEEDVGCHSSAVTYCRAYCIWSEMSCIEIEPHSNGS